MMERNGLFIKYYLASFWALPYLLTIIKCRLWFWIWGWCLAIGVHAPAIMGHKIFFFFILLLSSILSEKIGENGKKKSLKKWNKKVKKSPRPPPPPKKKKKKCQILLYSLLVCRCKQSERRTTSVLTALTKRLTAILRPFLETTRPKKS